MTGAFKGGGNAAKDAVKGISQKSEPIWWVDGNVSKTGDGSADRPYKTIVEAITSSGTGSGLYPLILFRDRIASTISTEPPFQSSKTKLTPGYFSHVISEEPASNIGFIPSRFRVSNIVDAISPAAEKR